MTKHKRRKKQKRMLSIITIIVAPLLIVGVAIYFLMNRNEEREASTGLKESFTKVAENVGEVKSNNTPENEENSYENVISGTGKISFSYYKNNILSNVEYPDYQDELFSYLDSTDYTLPDLIDEFNNIFSKEDRYFGDDGVTYLGYSYLDCGNDGNMELALYLVCPVVEETSGLTMILKEINDEVQVVYAFCEWSRSDREINEYGVINGGGSGGASLHGWSTGVIDANGKYIFGYSEEEQSDINMFYTGTEHELVDTEAYEGNIVIYSLYTRETTADDYQPQYYSYAVYKDYEEEMDIPNLYTDSEYQRLMDTYDIDFITMDELDKKVEDRLTEIGITEQMLNGKNLEYIELHF